MHEVKYNNHKAKNDKNTKNELKNYPTLYM